MGNEKKAVLCQKGTINVYDIKARKIIVPRIIMPKNNAAIN